MLPVISTPIHPTDSLVESVVQYEQFFKHVRLLERGTARRIMNAVDLAVSPGPQRDTLRKEILDALAESRRDMLKWVQSASNVTENRSNDSSSD